MWVPSVLAANLGAVGFPTTWGGVVKAFVSQKQHV